LIDIFLSETIILRHAQIEQEIKFGEWSECQASFLNLIIVKIHSFHTDELIREMNTLILMI